MLYGLLQFAGNRANWSRARLDWAFHGPTVITQGVKAGKRGKTTAPRTVFPACTQESCTACPKSALGPKAGAFLQPKEWSGHLNPQGRRYDHTMQPPAHFCRRPGSNVRLLQCRCSDARRKYFRSNVHGSCGPSLQSPGRGASHFFHSFPDGAAGNRNSFIAEWANEFEFLPDRRLRQLWGREQRAGAGF